MNRRQLWSGVTVLIIVALAVAGCAGNSQDGQQGESVDDPVEVLTAEQIYNNNCASCHGGNLEGRSGPNLETVGNHLSEEEIDDIIANGRGQMPAMKQLSADERAELASWLAGKK